MAVEHFIAITLFSAQRHKAGAAPLYQENIMLVRAESEDQAREITTRNARENEVAYRNHAGETVAWAFERIVDVNPALDSDLSQPCVDLYSRHFSNIEAYEQFDQSPGDDTA